MRGVGFPTGASACCGPQPWGLLSVPQTQPCQDTGSGNPGVWVPVPKERRVRPVREQWADPWDLAGGDPSLSEGLVGVGVSGTTGSGPHRPRRAPTAHPTTSVHTRLSVLGPRGCPTRERVHGPTGALALLTTARAPSRPGARSPPRPRPPGTVRRGRPGRRPETGGSCLRSEVASVYTGARPRCAYLPQTRLRRRRLH